MVPNKYDILYGALRHLRGHLPTAQTAMATEPATEVRGGSRKVRGRFQVCFLPIVQCNPSASRQSYGRQNCVIVGLSCGFYAPLGQLPSLRGHSALGAHHDAHLRGPLPSFSLSGMPSVDTTGADEQRTQAILTELFGPVAARVRGRGRPIVYLYLLFSLVFLRHRDRAKWAQVRDDVRDALDEQHDPQELLWAIGRHVVEALRRADMPPNMPVSLDALEPETVDDVAHIVRLCEELGTEAFHPLIDRFESWGKPDDEQFFTPRSIVRLVVGLLLKDATVPARVHDPYVGTGEFLMGAMEVAKGFRLSGTSPSQDLLGLASMRLHALNYPNVELHVAPKPQWDGSAGPQADYIMSNPPFNGRRGSHPQTRDEDWICGPPPPHSDNYAWLQHILMSLAPGGRAAVLMPNRAAVSPNPRELLIRRKMIEQGAVRFVVALPRQLFAGTAAPAMVWGLSRPTEPAEPAERVLLIDARRAGTKTGKQRVFASQEIEAMVDCLRRWEAGDERFSDAMADHGAAVSAPTKEIAKRAHSLAPSDYLTEAPPLTDREVGNWIPRPADAMGYEARDAQQADKRVSDISLTRRGPNRHDHGWRDARLEEMCLIQAGPSHSLIKSAERTPYGLPLVLAAHLRGHRVSAEHLDRIHMSARAVKKYQLRQGDILLVRTGSVGPTALVTASETGWLPSTNLMRLRPSDGVDPHYLLALMSSPTVQKWIESRSESASAIPSISAATLKTLPVMLPPPDEQRRIGDLIDALDTQIAAHRTLAKAAENARATLADNLVNGLLTGSHSPEGWA